MKFTTFGIKLKVMSMEVRQKILERKLLKIIPLIIIISNSYLKEY